MPLVDESGVLLKEILNHFVVHPGSLHRSAEVGSTEFFLLAVQSEGKLFVISRQGEMRRYQIVCGTEVICAFRF